MTFYCVPAPGALPRGRLPFVWLAIALLVPVGPGRRFCRVEADGPSQGAMRGRSAGPRATETVGVGDDQAMVAAELPLLDQVHGVEAARRGQVKPGRDEEVHGLAELVDRSAEVLPLPPTDT